MKQRVLAQEAAPNICTYYGCAMQNGLPVTTGICLKRYPITLLFAMRDVKTGQLSLDFEEIWRGIGRGVAHIHSQGFVHNDLDGSNVVLDDSHNTVIIDFDSCNREGVSRAGKKGRSVGWCLEEQGSPSVSKRENDYYSLGLLRKFLDGEHDPTNIGYTGRRELSPMSVADILTLGQSGEV